MSTTNDTTANNVIELRKQEKAARAPSQPGNSDDVDSSIPLTNTEFSAVSVQALFETMNFAIAKTITQTPDRFGLFDVLRNMHCEGELERVALGHTTGAMKVYLALLFDPSAQGYFKIIRGFISEEAHRDA